MPKQTVEPVFNRRSFLFFLFTAPSAILILIALVVLAQYKQLHSIVSSRPAVGPFEWNAADRARLDSVLGSLSAFSAGAGSDTLRLPASDLNLLAAASPVLRQERLYFRISATDTLLIVESTQSIRDQRRRFSWIFKKVIPEEFQYLNARLEGLPTWQGGRLDFAPERGFLNGSKVSKVTLKKRDGMSPRDFVDNAGVPAYQALTGVIDTVFFENQGVTLVRVPKAMRN
jgi:hypothetical protein